MSHPVDSNIKDLLDFARDKLQIQVVLQKFRKIQLGSDQTEISDDRIAQLLRDHFVLAGYSEQKIPQPGWFEEHIFEFIPLEQERQKGSEDSLYA